MKFLFKIFFLILFFIKNSFAITIINDTEIESFLYQIIKPLEKSAEISNLKINILEDPSFNAFVTAGNEVFINSGLIMNVPDIPSLQAVISHEIGHYIGGHLIILQDKLKKEIYKSVIFQSLGLGLILSGSEALGSGIIAGSTSIAKQGVLSFSRDEERLADDLGVNIMQKANLNPEGFITVFSAMQKQSFVIESKISPVNINHPLTSERIKNIKDKIASFPKQKYKSFDSNKLALVKAKLAGYLLDKKSVNILYPKSKNNTPAIYANAILNLQNGDLKAAKSKAKILIDRDNSNPYFYEILGEIEFKAGNNKEAIKAYKKSIDILKGNAPQILAQLALVLENSGENEEAIRICKKSLLMKPSPLVYLTLAKLYKEGPDFELSMAYYYNLLNDDEKTKFFAKKALKGFSKNSPQYIKTKDLLNKI